MSTMTRSTDRAADRAHATRLTTEPDPAELVVVLPASAAIELLLRPSEASVDAIAAVCEDAAPVVELVVPFSVDEVSAPGALAGAPPVR